MAVGSGAARLKSSKMYEMTAYFPGVGYWVLITAGSWVANSDEFVTLCFRPSGAVQRDGGEAMILLAYPESE